MSGKKFDINKIWMTTLILFLICAVIAGALAYTNSLTKDRIAGLALEAENDSRKDVLAADSYTEQSTEFEWDGQTVSATYYEAVKGEETVGYVVTAASKGYGGDVKVMIGIGADRTVARIKVLDASNETPGLGYNVTKAGFGDPYVGQDLEDVSGDPKTDGIGYQTSATYSSRAVRACVQYALTLVQSVPEPVTKGESADEPGDTAEEETTENEQEETINEQE